MTAVFPKTSRKAACPYGKLIKHAPRVTQQLRYAVRKSSAFLKKYRPAPKESIERVGAVSRISVGVETYPFLRELSLLYVFDGAQTIATLQGLPKRIMHGVGTTREDAKRSLFVQIHTQFQRLYKTLPMQRSAEDEVLWKSLDAVINTERYRRDRKTILPITASMVESTAFGIVLDWFGGGRLSLPAEVLEGEWNTLTPGDWIEAVLLRRAGDGRILKATMVRQIPPIEPFTDDEVIAWHKNLPAADLPSSTAE